jgi:hypothetical protein
MGRRDLETIFLPSFKAAVTEAGARSVMAAYNEIDGIPNANNEDLLYEHLRNVRAHRAHRTRTHRTRTHRTRTRLMISPVFIVGVGSNGVSMASCSPMRVR